MTRLTPLLLILAATACSKSEDPEPTDNAAPTAQVASPVTGSITTSTTVELVGNITDPDGDDDIASVTWSSSVDGVLVDGQAALPVDRISTASTTLSPGNHVITLVVTDQADATSQDSVTIVVVDEATTSAPTILLEPPFANGAVDTLQPTTFTATVASETFAPAALSGTWTLESTGGAPEVRGPDIPSANGELSVTFETMPLGDLELTLVVVDPDGEEATATLDLVGIVGAYTDDDADGVTVADGDCDDTDAAAFPGAEELCNGTDNDCDRSIDNRDIDGDGYIDSACTAYTGTLPTGDCADDDASVSPGVIELENGQDDNCNGEIDDGTGNYDDDGDCVCENEDCFDSIAEGCTLTSGDCDDTDATVSPLADELCNDLDNDCNGTVSDKDVDNDGFIDSECDGFFVGEAQDCDDTNIDINPDAADLPDAADGNVDNNCDGIDGDVSAAIFMTESGATSGDCTLEAPCSSLDAALTASTDPERFQILMAEGTYPGPTQTMNTQVFLSGGYSTDFAEHGGTEVDSTVIERLAPVVVIQEQTVTFQSIEFDTLNMPPGQTASILVNTGGEIVLDGITLERPTMGDGRNGPPGVAGWSEAAPSGNGGYWDTVDDGDTNPGVSNPDCLGGIVDRFSGFGGADGTISQDGGDGGPSITSPFGTIYRGGAGGEPGRSGDAAEDGDDGTTEHGEGGAGGINDIRYDGTNIYGGTGATGTLGEHGTHGRGGGGAADGQSGLNLRRGFKGGSGGSYGCRAVSAGVGGERGQASVGIIAKEGTVTVVSPSFIVGGEGGNGGRGGNGALGQWGGQGGIGRGATNLTFASGSGGDGGDGGASGGGGGGSGGNVYGLWLLDGSTLTGMDNLTIERGLTGFGGVGGSATISSFPAKGEDGDDGLSIDMLVGD